MPLPPNQPFIEAIAERVRAVVSRQPGRNLAALAASLAVPEDQFRRLIEDRDHLIDAGFLIDVLAALVRELGLDPQWLLTGSYDANSHRRAVQLMEDNGVAGERSIRELLLEGYHRLRAGLKPWTLMSG